MNLKTLFGKKGAKTIKNAIWREHPITSATLGICSALAISNKVENAIAMSAGVIFVLVLTALIISTLRKLIPSRVRIIIYMITIAAGVTIVDLALLAFFPTISEAMGPYVPLIITNCIIMGRAEAFFVQNPPKLAVIDALANGLAYMYTLMAIAIIREVFGFGTILGIRVTPAGWVDWVVLAAPAGAFFVLGVFLWIVRTWAGVEPPASS
jgi:Na+-transporting NADH:ubiquinone oxidoreductase subunit D